jgi:predicted amidohydrolase YtcJ
MSNHADSLVTNAHIFTADGERPFAEALAVKGNRIIFVGGIKETAELRGPSTRVIDGDGRTLLPGFIDCHFHLLDGSSTLDDLQLEGATSYEHFSSALLAFSTHRPEAAWLAGYGLRYDLGPDHTPLKRQHIDAIISNRPVVVFSYDYHTAWANTLALKQAGIFQGGVCGPNSEIVLDEGGIATGELREDDAYAPILTLLPEPDAAQKRSLLQKGLKLANQVGLTSVHNMDGDEAQAAVYAEVEAAGELTLRVYVPYSVTPQTPFEALEKEAAPMKAKYRSDRLRGGSVKMFMDGVVESYTGLLVEDYADLPGEHGDSNYEVERFNNLVTEADRLGLQVCVHSVGDLGVRRVLDACQVACQKNGPRDRRCRVEHLEVIHPDDLHRFAELGVIASMQPAHAPLHLGDGDVWPQRVGPQRWPFSFAWQDLRQAGARLAFGSDWPVASQNPMLGIYATQNRQPWQAGMPNQRLSLADALLAYTREAAHAEFQDHHKGQLKPGYLADMVLLSRDLFQTPAEDLLEVHSWMTMVDGQIVYEA